MAELQELIVTEEALRRPARSADPAAENRALRMLVRELENPHGDVLTRLCEVAMKSCLAQSAGVSLIENDGVQKVFRWHAIAGLWAKYTGGGLPRNASPCGLVIDRNATLVMARPHEAFPLVAQADPPIAEVLLAPFHILGEPVGTVWVISHDDGRKFDAEDARVVESLAPVAAAIFLARNELKHAAETRDEALRSNERLKRTVERLLPAIEAP